METINDIVQEIRSVVANKTMGKMTPKMREYEKFIKGIIREWPDRIEAAYLHDRQCPVEGRAVLEDKIECFKSAINSMVETDSEHGETIAELHKENSHLKAALKPVLDFKLPDRGVFSVECEYAETIFEMITAVRDAKRIYREGEVK